jgi:hypothetical protein
MEPDPWMIRLRHQSLKYSTIRKLTKLARAAFTSASMGRDDHVPETPAPHRNLNLRGRGALLGTLPSCSKSTSEEGMGAEAGSSWFLPLIAPDQLHPGEEVAAAGLQEISLGLVGWQGEGGVQGVKPEEVAMSGSSGWAGSVIAGSPEVVQALGSHTGHRALTGDTLREFADADGDSIEDPMDRDTHRAVGVGHDEGEPFGALGRLGPAKRGRDVGAIAGVLGRDLPTRPERGAPQLEGPHRYS